MLMRAILLLVFVVALSVAATNYFGQEVLIALGLLLTQAKVIAKKLASIELPVLITWFKSQAGAFLRIELVKKWLTTSVVPLILGNVVLRRVSAFVAQYRRALSDQYARLLTWYAGLGPMERAVSALIILFATVALSVSSLGLWLILFSVKLPLWIGAAVASLGRMMWSSVQKMLFRAIAFLQLAWVWRGLTRVLPASWLERKRRFDFRVARAVVRRRRLTIKQLAERKDNLPFRMGILVEFLLPTRTISANSEKKANDVNNNGKS